MSALLYLNKDFIFIYIFIILNPYSTKEFINTILSVLSIEPR